MVNYIVFADNRLFKVIEIVGVIEFLKNMRNFLVRLGE